MEDRPIEVVAGPVETGDVDFGGSIGLGNQACLLETPGGPWNTVAHDD